MIVVLLILGAAVAGGMWFQRRSNQRALTTLFRNGGAKSRSISTSVRPGRAANANANANGGGGHGEYSNPAYAAPTYGTPSGGCPLPAGAITPVYHVSGGTDGTGTGTGAASPTYQIPMELAAPDPTYQVPMAPAAATQGGETGLGYLEVKAVTNQPMYRVLDRSLGSIGSAVASPQLYDVRDATGIPRPDLVSLGFPCCSRDFSGRCRPLHAPCGVP